MNHQFYSPVVQTMPQNLRDSGVAFVEETNRVSKRNQSKVARKTTISMAMIDWQVEKNKINNEIRSLNKLGRHVCLLSSVSLPK